MQLNHAERIHRQESAMMMNMPNDNLSDKLRTEKEELQESEIDFLASSEK